jgi:hypothetical protein
MRSKESIPVLPLLLKVGLRMRQSCSDFTFGHVGAERGVEQAADDHRHACREQLSHSVSILSPTSRLAY